MHNRDVADIFRTIADLLDIRGDNRFRIRAYRNAARTVESQPGSVAEMVGRGEDLTRLSGLGEDLAGKVETIVRTGSHPLLEELSEEVPRSLRELLQVSGLGPRGVHAIHSELGVTDLDGLRRAAEKGEIEGLEGFGEKTQRKILAETEEMAGAERRTLLNDAEEVADSLIAHLESVRGVKKVCVAGSLRRRKETVGDLDVLVSSRRDARPLEHLQEMDEVEDVLAGGETKTTVILRSGMQVDVRSVAHASYGAALVYFTGSKQHNIRLRKRGVERGLKINEYGVHRDGRKVAGRTEEEVYGSVGLEWITPELREDRGEMEASEEGSLPELVTEEDIRGDLHAHTKRTDGHHTIREMAEAAREMGYEYLAITEHSKRVTVAGGLNAEELARHAEAIGEADSETEGISLLKGVEVDILEDGSLDLPPDVLRRLDVVVASVHYGFDMPRERMTERILRAMDDPCLSIVGHPTGRKLGQREPYDVDLDAILEGARERGCHMELNAFPDRLDLTDAACRRAKEVGVKVAVSTDAHRTGHLRYIRYGVGQARRGWLSARDVLNTRPLGELRKLLDRG